VKTQTDEQLLADHLKGRPDAFELLVRRHANELFRFVMRFTNSASAADDVVQETFLQAYKSARGFDVKRRFRPWLFTIGANKARDWLRSRGRRSEVRLDAFIESDGDEGKTFSDLMASEDEPPMVALEAEEQRRAVRQIVSEMPDILREVLVLAYYHRFAYRDIATVLDIPVGTVKSRLHSAVAHFGNAYRKSCSPSED
jgi:RNA polymerase sigma-70 factor, ECF subfamily